MAEVIRDSVPAVPYDLNNADTGKSQSNSPVFALADTNLTYSFNNLNTGDVLDTIQGFSLGATKTVALTLVQYTGSFASAPEISYEIINIATDSRVGNVQKVKGEYKSSNIIIAFPNIPAGNYLIRIIGVGGGQSASGNGYTNN